MLLSPIFDLVLKCSILFDKPGYKNSIHHFLSRYTYILEKNIKVFGPISGNSKIAYPMDYSKYYLNI